MSIEKIESTKVEEWKVACQDLGEGLAAGDDEAKATFDQYVNSDEYHLQARALSALLSTAETKPEVALDYLTQLRLRGRINQVVNAVRQEIIATQPQLQVDDFIQSKLNESRLLELLDNAERQNWDNGLIKRPRFSGWLRALAVGIVAKGKDGWEFLEKLAFGNNEQKTTAAKLLEALAPDLGTTPVGNSADEVTEENPTQSTSMVQLEAQRLIVRLVRDESTKVWDAAARTWGKAALTDEKLFLWLNKALLYSVVDRAVKKHALERSEGTEEETGSFDPWQHLDGLEPQIAELLNPMNQAQWRVNIHIQRHSILALGVLAAHQHQRQITIVEAKGGKLVQRKGVTVGSYFHDIMAGETGETWCEYTAPLALDSFNATLETFKSQIDGCLASDEPQGRVNLATALGKIGNGDAFEQLSLMAEDSPYWDYLTVQDWDYQNQADENLIKAFAQIVGNTNNEQVGKDALKQLIEWAKGEDGAVRQVDQRASIKELVRLNGENPELNIAKKLSRIRLPACALHADRDAPSNEQIALFHADVTKVAVFREVWKGLEEERKRQKQESFKDIIETAAMGEGTPHIQTEQTIVFALADSPFRSMLLASDSSKKADDVQNCAFDLLEQMATVEQRAIATVHNLIADKQLWQSLSPKDKADVLYAMKELFSGGIVLPGEKELGVQNDRYKRVKYLTQLYNRNMGEARKDEILVNLTDLGIREGDFELANTALRTLKENLNKNSDRRLRGINDVLPLVDLEQDERGTFYKDLAIIVERSMDETARQDISYDAVLHQIYRLLDNQCNPQILHEITEYARDEGGIVTELCATYENLAKSIAEGEKTYRKAKESIEQFLEAFEPLLQKLPSEPKSETFSAAKDSFTNMEGLMNNYLLDGISDINFAGLKGNLLRIRGISEKDSPSETIQQITDKIRRKVEELNHQVEAFIQIDFKLIRDEEKMLNEIELTLDEIQTLVVSLPPVEEHLLSGILNGWKEDLNQMCSFFRELRITLAEHDEENISQMSYGQSIPEHRKHEKEAILKQQATRKSITEFWQFKVRWLVGRYDLERAYEVARNSPEELEPKTDFKMESSNDFKENQSEHPQHVEDSRSVKHKPPRRWGIVLGIAALLLVIPYIAYPILDVFKVKLPFSIGLEYRGDLDNSTISTVLRQEFEKKGISLSENVTASTEEKGSTWRITDNNRMYTVRIEKEKLNIYKVYKAYGVLIQCACTFIIILLFLVLFVRLKVDKATASVLFLPRLLAATAITYFVLVLGCEIWGFAISLSGKWILPAVVLSAGACLGYACLEIKRTDESKTLKIAFGRALKVVTIGLLQSYIIGFVVTTFLGKKMVETWAMGMGMEVGDFANQTVWRAIPKMQEFHGFTVFPTILLLSTFTVLFVGLFLELLKEKREITEEF